MQLGAKYRLLSNVRLEGDDHSHTRFFRSLEDLWLGWIEYSIIIEATTTSRPFGLRLVTPSPSLHYPSLLVMPCLRRPDLRYLAIPARGQ